jgi:hypothetical protein
VTNAVKQYRMFHSDEAEVILYDIEWEIDNDDSDKPTLPDRVSYLFPIAPFLRYVVNANDLAQRLLDEALSQATDEHHYFIRDCRVDFKH